MIFSWFGRERQGFNGPTTEGSADTHAAERRKRSMEEARKFVGQLQSITQLVRRGDDAGLKQVLEEASPKEIQQSGRNPRPRGDYHTINNGTAIEDAYPLLRDKYNQTTDPELKDLIIRLISHIGQGVYDAIAHNREEAIALVRDYVKGERSGIPPTSPSTPRVSEKRQSQAPEVVKQDQLLSFESLLQLVPSGLRSNFTSDYWNTAGMSTDPARRVQAVFERINVTLINPPSPSHSAQAGMLLKIFNDNPQLLNPLHGDPSALRRIQEVSEALWELKGEKAYETFLYLSRRTN